MRKTNMNINAPIWEAKLLADSKTSLDWVVELMLIGNCFLFAWLLNEPVCSITIGCRMCSRSCRGPCRLATSDVTWQVQKQSRHNFSVRRTLYTFFCKNVSSNMSRHLGIVTILVRDEEQRADVMYCDIWYDAVWKTATTKTLIV